MLTLLFAFMAALLWMLSVPKTPDSILPIAALAGLALIGAAWAALRAAMWITALEYHRRRSRGPGLWEAAQEHARQDYYD